MRQLFLLIAYSQKRPKPEVRVRASGTSRVIRTGTFIQNVVVVYYQISCFSPRNVEVRACPMQALNRVCPLIFLP
jgi:hypothetical protein